VAKNDILIDEIVKSDLFKILSDGDIFSRIAKNGQICGCYRRIGGRKSDGYIRFRYNNEFILVHRVIYRKFKGELISGLTINHKNGIKYDNRVDNLEQVTLSDNCKHAYDIGLMTSNKCFGRDNGKYKHGRYSKAGGVV